MTLLNKFLLESTQNNVLRKSLIEKLDLPNTYACPTLRNGCVFIELKRLENFDSSRILAAMFVLRLLTGCKPYIVRFTLFQTFHEKDYEALALVNFNSSPSYNFIEFVSTNILPFLPKADFSFYALKNKEGVVANFTIADLSFIRVVETHSIFFKWHDKVCVKLDFNSKELPAVEILLGALKFNF